MAAVALAIRLYRADHGGAWPASLGELVPAYLPAIPIDPLASNGSPLHYVQDAPGWEVSAGCRGRRRVCDPAAGGGAVHAGADCL